MILKDVRVRDKIVDVEVNFHFYYWNEDKTLPDVPKIPGFVIDYVEAYTGNSYGDMAYTYEYRGLPPMRNAAYLSLDDNGFVEHLIEKGYAYPTGVSSTFESFTFPSPLWVFKERFLKDIGGKDYLDYEKAYREFVDDYGEGFIPDVSDEDLKKVGSMIQG